jgi:hypothetical protein
MVKYSTKDNFLFVASASSEQFIRSFIAKILYAFPTYP